MIFPCTEPTEGSLTKKGLLFNLRMVTTTASHAQFFLSMKLRERVAELEREWVKHPQTIEAKAQWDAVALALGADKDCPDAVRAAASRLRAAEIKLRAENEALRADAEWKLTADALPEDGRLVLFEVDAKAPSRFEYLDGQVFACTYYTANERYGSAFGVPGLTIRASQSSG